MYVEHESRDVRDEAKQRDRIILPLLRETAAPTDIDGNWQEAYEYIQSVVSRLEGPKSQLLQPEDALLISTPHVKRWRLNAEQVLRQQRAMDACMNNVKLQVLDNDEARALDQDLVNEFLALDLVDRRAGPPSHVCSPVLTESTEMGQPAVEEHALPLVES